MNIRCTEYLNNLHLMVDSLPALRGPFFFHLRYNFFLVLMRLTFSTACDSYSYYYRTLNVVLLPGPFIRYQVYFMPFFFRTLVFIDNFMQGYHSVHVLARAREREWHVATDQPERVQRVC
jgi:hypothetical protein